MSDRNNNNEPHIYDIIGGLAVFVALVALAVFAV